MIGTNPNPDAPIFDALLTPHRSLGRTGFLILMGAMLAAWAVVGAVTLAHGQWPVAGFFGLDVVALYAAFRWTYYTGRAREEVTLSRTRLAIRQIAPSGKAREHHFNPFWTRFRVERHPEIGVTAMTVSGHGRRVGVGGFLNPGDRESFSAAFQLALAQARR
ncbi:MAG: DUF2244 domain-containing protein [Phyllobacteriaceae bacterium]|nr:DUF2244 domain-containing protein [Phyllobacteriaceae bacterium]